MYDVYDGHDLYIVHGVQLVFPCISHVCIISTTHVVGCSCMLSCTLCCHQPAHIPPRHAHHAQLRWVRLGTDLDMLDAPGVLPMSFSDQVAAQRLAICNDIGEASYVDSLVAAALLENVRTLPGHKKHMARLQQRYGVPFESTMTGEDFVHAGMTRLTGGWCWMVLDGVGWWWWIVELQQHHAPPRYAFAVAEQTFVGEVERAGARVLKDYRTGALGWICLEPPPKH